MIDLIRWLNLYIFTQNWVCSIRIRPYLASSLNTIPRSRQLIICLIFLQCAWSKRNRADKCVQMLSSRFSELFTLFSINAVYHPRLRCQYKNKMVISLDFNFHTNILKLVKVAIDHRLLIKFPLLYWNFFISFRTNNFLLEKMHPSSRTGINN